MDNLLHPGDMCAKRDVSKAPKPVGHGQRGSYMERLKTVKGNRDQLIRR